MASTLANFPSKLGPFRSGRGSDLACPGAKEGGVPFSLEVQQPCVVDALLTLLSHGKAGNITSGKGILFENVAGRQSPCDKHENIKLQQSASGYSGLHQKQQKTSNEQRGNTVWAQTPLTQEDLAWCITPQTLGVAFSRHRER